MHKERRRIAKIEKEYHSLKPICSSFLGNRICKGRAIGFGSEERIGGNDKYRLEIRAREVEIYETDWADYGRRKASIDQVTDLIRGNIRRIDFVIDEEVYKEMQNYLKNGSPLSNRMIFVED